MTIGTDTSFIDTQNSIVTDAFILLGYAADKETLSADDYSLAARLLNRMLLSWQSIDLQLWLQTEATLFLQQNQTNYVFNSATVGDHCTNSYIETTTTSALSAGTTAIPLVSVVGMNPNDNIGIQLDSGATFWAVIETVISFNNTVFLNASLPSSAALGNFVHTYTNKITRPLKIYQARRYNFQAQQDVQIKKMTRAEYFAFPSKQNVAQPVQYYYDPQDTQGNFYMWGKPPNSQFAIKFTYLRRIYDMVNMTDNPDVPTEWLEAIVYNLAVRLAFALGQTDRLPVLKPVADEMFMTLKMFDREEGAIYVQPSADGLS